MAKQYDVTLKTLLDAYPQDWLRLAGVPEGVQAESIDITIEDADLSTITAQADKVFRIHGDEPWLLHLEAQSTYAASLPHRTQLYSTLATHRTELPVRSVIILLAPKADGPEMTGRLTRRLPDGREYLAFDYDIIRLWETPAQSLLTGGLGTLPLAIIGHYDDAQAASVAGEMKRRFKSESSADRGSDLLTAAYYLAGLRFPDDLFCETLFTVVKEMEGSTTYEKVKNIGVEEGRVTGGVETARELLLDLGQDKLGPPPDYVREAIDQQTDLTRLKTLTRQILHVQDWSELFPG